ncbi:hypothetical protein SERLA73DRAFT_68124 [Serpula lacrymans var. lacrymans S7.3]|uniref:Integrase catalytic domain-containing protein n=1 Tax=Serpula lacrymans var. lacrymans (strain S7.3) TaxID=936435 RepID=F8PH01_SERL3|nr:hypothetical protein SERLA73DRAFT_68124 [Serpula lacrymans var. lacrymans S7.3]
MERLNQELKQYLHTFINDRQTNWAKWLNIVQFLYNIKQSLATGKVPFKLTRLYLPRMGVEPSKSKNGTAESMVKDMKSVLDKTCKALFKTAEQMKDKAEHRHSKAPDYKVGDLVYWIKEVKTNVVELELPK